MGIDKTLKFDEIDYCPFTCNPDKENGKEGIMIDVLKLSFEPLGYHVSFDIMPYSRAVNEVKSGRYHGIAIVINQHVLYLIYPEVHTIKKNLAMVAPYGFDFSNTTIESIKANKLVVVQDYKYDNKNPTIDDYIAKNKLNKNKTIFLTGNDTVERALKLLVNNRADVIIKNRLTAEYYVAKLKLQNKIGFSYVD